jgi:hypothetical protein
VMAAVMIALGLLFVLVMIAGAVAGYRSRP